MNFQIYYQKFNQHAQIFSLTQQVPYARQLEAHQPQDAQGNLRKSPHHSHQRSEQVSVRQDEDLFSGGSSGLLGEVALRKAKSLRHNDPEACAWLAWSLQVHQNQAVNAAFAVSSSWYSRASFAQAEARVPRRHRHTVELARVRLQAQIYGDQKKSD